jgi:hypothetical protein
MENNVEFIVTSIVIILTLCALPCGLKIKGLLWKMVLYVALVVANLAVWIVFNNNTMINFVVVCVLFMIYVWMKKRKDNETDSSNSQL